MPSGAGRVRALVLAATSGVVDYQGIVHPADCGLPPGPTGATERGGTQETGCPPGRWCPMAREQPALYFLYRAIDDLSLGLDRSCCAGRLMATRNQAPEVVRHLGCRCSSSWRGGCHLSSAAALALASVIRNAPHRARRQGGPLGVFRAGRTSSTGS